MLTDDVRVALRVTSDATDSEIEAMIDTAIADMRRVGVRDSLLNRESLTPMALNAVVMFCKANYGFDNKDAGTFWNRYQWTVTALMNSSMNECDAYADIEYETDTTEPTDEPTDDPTEPTEPTEPTAGGDEP